MRLMWKNTNWTQGPKLLVEHFYLSLLQPLFPPSPTSMIQFTLLSPFWHLCYQLKLTSQALILDRVSLMVMPKISDLTENYRNTIRKSKTALTQLWAHFTSQIHIKILYNWWDKEEKVFLPAMQRSLSVRYVPNTFTRCRNVRDS